MEEAWGKYCAKKKGARFMSERWQDFQYSELTEFGKHDFSS